MRDIADHLLDLCQNSISAGASLISMDVSKLGQLLQISISDDGCGMDEATCSLALSPFGTSRKTRKVGLGIPLAAEHARQTGGALSLESSPGKGTCLKLSFDTSHLDCPPMGDMASSLLALMLGNPHQPEFCIQISGPGGFGVLDTRQVKQALQGLPITSPPVQDWLQETLNELIRNLI